VGGRPKGTLGGGAAGGQKRNDSGDGTTGGCRDNAADMKEYGEKTEEKKNKF